MLNAQVLVVCRDAARREGFVRALSRAGWENILSASSTAEAAGHMGKAPRVCAVVDAELADIPGLKAVPILQQICPQAKIIFTAPENTRELEEQVQALNVFYYYISTADRAELVLAVEEAAGPPRAHVAGLRPKVLVVDDDRDYQETVRSILEQAGYNVCSAYSEPQGLLMARGERPDIILLDIIMESTTAGFAFCHKARRDPHIRHIPILGVSAIEERIGLRSAPDGERNLFPVDGYLRKPVVADELLSELNKFLPERRNGHDGRNKDSGETGVTPLRACGG
jgi:CheY-like chemotaxis protein